MDHLLREKAPISDAGWEQIEAEATRTLRHYLAARKLVDYTAAGGWTRSAEGLGRVNEVTSADAAVTLRTRVVQPISEVRVNFELSRKELESLDRGAHDYDTGPIIAAARAAAYAEDTAVFNGNEGLGIAGIETASTNPTFTLADDTFATLPDQIAHALDILQEKGVEGPYAMAMGPRAWTAVMESNEGGGYPLLKHLRLMLDVPVIWAPAVSGAVLVSQRGGDFEILGGQDWSIGYLHHDRETISMYLEESFTSLVNTPEAAVRFEYAS